MRMFAAIVLVGLAVLASASAVPAQSADLPAGWMRAGDNPAEYEMGMDPKGGKSGKACAFIRGRAADPQGFGTLMQMFDAGEYLGKRLRLSASVKSAGITKSAALWMRIDGAKAPDSQKRCAGSRRREYRRTSTMRSGGGGPGPRAGAP